MASSSLLTGWIRVASGLRMVAAAAASNASVDGINAATVTSRHGAELMSNLRVATKAAEFMATSTNSPNKDMEESVTTRRENESNGQNSSISVDEKYLQTQMRESTKQESNPRNLPQKQSKEEEGMFDIASTKPPTLYDGISVKNVDVNEANTRYLKEGKAVPSTRIGRAVGFASLGIGLAAGTTFEVATRLMNQVLSSSNDSEISKGSPMASDANADRLVKTLCRMRGAALKLGQMLSIQDETLLPPALAKALEQVRQGADSMPASQLDFQMKKELGENWRDKFYEFDEVPFAAASIGQVHRATLPADHSGDGAKQNKQVVVKVQYPGVANSIESDLSNLSMLITMSRLAPPGLFIERVIDVGRKELKAECNYVNEMNNQKRMKKYIESDKELSKARFFVPNVYEELSTAEVLTTEYCPGGTIDKVVGLHQDERNRIGRNILRLTMKELFVWRFMQTDPNFANFLYDFGTGTTFLIDFGSTLEYDKSFVDGYLRIVWAAANRDADTLMKQSHITGFLNGEENNIMLEAHKLSGFVMGDPFATTGPYDFRSSNITSRMSEHGSAFLQHRLTPPPEEVYTLHRKLVGAFNLCIKLGAIIECRDLLEEIVESHVFDDGQDHPMMKNKKLSN